MSRRALIIAAALIWGGACSNDHPVSPQPPPPPPPPPPEHTPADYDVIDLGSLGGNRTAAFAFNDSGHVVGQSLLADGSASHAFLWKNGVMRDLGAAEDMTSSAHVITNSGRIAGATLTDQMPQSRVFLWINGVRTDLGAARGPRIGVMGITSTRVLARHADDHHFVSSLWENGVRRELGGLNGYPYAEARAMNSRGQIVGTAMVADYIGSEIQHPFVWENGVMRDLGLLGDYPCADRPEINCGWGIATDINSRGDVVGTSSTGPGQRPDAVLWTNNSIINLGFERAVAINDAGEIVGTNDDASYYVHRGTTMRLPSFGGGGTVVVDINDLGMVVGSSLTSSGERRAFVWRYGEAALTDLGSGRAIAINSRGDIIGGTDERAILWRLKVGS